MRRGGGGLVAALGGGGGLRGGARRGWLGEAVSLREEEALGGMVGFFEARVEAGGTHTAKMTG